MKSTIVALFAMAALLPGCASLAVGPASPRPNVVLAQNKTPGALVLAPAIADEFVIPHNASVNAVPVRGWRGTLQAGFKNAFPSGGGRKLEILSAELSFSPAAVTAGGTTRAVVATIRFKARVLDASDKELAVVAGTVRARETTVSPTEEGMTDNASKAVEALYEMLTAELLAKA